MCDRGRFTNTEESTIEEVGRNRDLDVEMDVWWCKDGQNKD